MHFPGSLIYLIYDSNLSLIQLHGKGTLMSMISTTIIQDHNGQFSWIGVYYKNTTYLFSWLTSNFNCTPFPFCLKTYFPDFSELLIFVESQIYVLV